MITAVEIRNQQFRKSINGYNCNEVRNFMSQLAQDYENLYLENSELKEKIQALKYEVEKYRKMEETMNNSIIVAQQAADMLKENAHHEANLIVENSKKRIAEIFMIYQEIIKRLNLMNMEMKTQLNVEMEMLEKNQKRVEEMTDFFYSKDIKELMEKLSKVSLES